MKLGLSFIFLLFNLTLFGQNKGKITGQLYSSEKEPLEKATIAVLQAQDSTVLSYALSGTNGKFSFIKLPLEQELILYVSHINATATHKNFKLHNVEEYDFREIMLEPKSLEEVVIQMTPPIRMNKDTLEYNSKYFKTRPNANVEELLQKLPGLQVNLDGSIYYQGKAVQSVRINNKDFFSQDLTIATRNLDASMIEKVQVYREKGDSKQVVLDDSDLPIILNLKTKQEFVKAQFGKFYGGGGTSDRYESGVLLNTFRDTLQISFIGYANNLSRKGFDYSELSEQGGFGRAENNNSSYYSYGGLQNNLSGAVNINYDIAKKLKTNFMYAFDQQNNYISNSGESQSSYADSTIYNNSTYNGTYNDYMHKMRAFARYHIDTTAMISYDVNVNITKRTSKTSSIHDSYRNQPSTPVQKGYSNTTNLGNNPTFQHNFKFEKKFNNKWVLSFTNELKRNTNKNDRHRISHGQYFLLGDSTINQHINESDNVIRTEMTNRINLQVPYKKIFTTDIYANHHLNKDKNTPEIYTKINADYFVDRDEITNDRKANIYSSWVGTKFNFQISKQIKASAGIEWLDKRRTYDYFGKNTSIEKQQDYWLPNLSFNIFDLNISYYKAVQDPSLHSFIGVDSDLHPTSITFASPYFDNEIVDAFNLHYHRYFQKLKLNISVYSNYSIENKSIGNATFYNIEDATSTSQYYQAKGLSNYNFGGNIRKELLQNKIWNTYFSANYNFYAYSSIGKTNGIENTSSTGRLNGNHTLSITWKDKIAISPSYQFSLSNTHNSSDDPTFRNLRDVTHNFGAGLRVNSVKKFTLETSYNVKNQPSNLGNARNNLHLINASIYYPIFAKGELKFTAFDLLNQNQNVYRYSADNYIGYGEQLTQKQYFLLGFVYKFLATPKKK